MKCGSRKGLGMFFYRDANASYWKYCLGSFKWMVKENVVAGDSQTIQWKAKEALIYASYYNIVRCYGNTKQWIGIGLKINILCTKFCNNIAYSAFLKNLPIIQTFQVYQLILQQLGILKKCLGMIFLKYCKHFFVCKIYNKLK